jgi:hypothetical protein
MAFSNSLSYSGVWKKESLEKIEDNNLQNEYEKLNNEISLADYIKNVELEFLINIEKLKKIEYPAYKFLYEACLDKIGEKTSYSLIGMLFYLGNKKVELIDFVKNGNYPEEDIKILKACIVKEKVVEGEDENTLKNRYLRVKNAFLKIKNEILVNEKQVFDDEKFDSSLSKKSNALVETNSGNLPSSLEEISKNLPFKDRLALKALSSKSREKINQVFKGLASSLQETSQELNRTQEVLEEQTKEHSNILKLNRMYNTCKIEHQKFLESFASLEIDIYEIEKKLDYLINLFNQSSLVLTKVLDNEKYWKAKNLEAFKDLKSSLKEINIILSFYKEEKFLNFIKLLKEWETNEDFPESALYWHSYLKERVNFQNQEIYTYLIARAQEIINDRKKIMEEFLNKNILVYLQNNFKRKKAEILNEPRLNNQEKEKQITLLRRDIFRKALNKLEEFDLQVAEKTGDNNHIYSEFFKSLQIKWKKEFNQLSVKVNL